MAFRFVSSVRQLDLVLYQYTQIESDEGGLIELNDFIEVTELFERFRFLRY